MNQFRATVALGFVIALFAGGLVCRGQSPDPASEFFPIMPWEIQPEKQGFMDEPGHGIESLRECGFNTVAFVRPDQVEDCERAGMKAIVTRPGGRVQWREMSDEAIEDYVKQVVEASGKSPALVGYFITDEPNVRDFPALGKAVAAVKKLVPGKLAYINLYPNYATLGAPDLSQLGTENYTEYLERYVAEVKPQFISYDNYRIQLSMDLQDPRIADSYFTNLLEVRRIAQKHNLPFWNIVTSNQIRPFTTVPSPANMLMQAYTTLAAGGRGLTWYTYYAGRYETAPIDKAGNRTVNWLYLKMVNDQVKVLAPIMVKLRSTGVYFTSPTSAEQLPALPGKIVQAIESPTAVMVGEFANEAEEKYVMVVNLSLEKSAKVTIKSKSARVECVSPVDGSMAPLAEDRSLWLTAGQGMLLKMR